jgi:hypothetical protein
MHEDKTAKLVLTGLVTKVTLVSEEELRLEKTASSRLKGNVLSMVICIKSR